MVTSLKPEFLMPQAILINPAWFAQTSNKAIAQAANVDLAAINYYHFKRTGRFISSCFGWRRMHYIDEQFLIRLAESPIPPTQKLEVFFQTIIDRLVEKISGIAMYLSVNYFHLTHLCLISCKMKACVNFN